MQEYVIVFESEYDYKDGDTVNIFDGVKGTIRKMPTKMPTMQYDFETYTTGFTKGCNYTIDKLHGINGEYDPEIDNYINKLKNKEEHK